LDDRMRYEKKMDCMNSEGWFGTVSYGGITVAEEITHTLHITR